jgi:arylsulfatase
MSKNRILRKLALLAAVGEADIKDKLLAGHEANGKTFKAHLDG